MATAALLGCAAAAVAQNGPVDTAADLHVVEEGVEDVNPLGVGRADFAADLAVPLGFGKVYELPPGPDGQRRSARRSGAVWVVFTRADYIRGEDGKQAVAPPNSTIYVGEPPGLREVQAPIENPLYNPLRVSTRQDLRAGVTPGGLEPIPPQAGDADAGVPQGQQAMPPEATVLTSESYRRGRVRDLLRAAADAP